MDTDSLSFEESVANRLSGWKTVLDSIASATKLITGPLFALGGGTWIASLNVVTVEAVPALPVIAGALLVVATATLLTAMATSYISNSIEKVSVEEREEQKAKLAAKALVQELQANNLCLTAERADGKSWSSTVKANTQNPHQPCV